MDNSEDHIVNIFAIKKTCLGWWCNHVPLVIQHLSSRPFSIYIFYEIDKAQGITMGVIEDHWTVISPSLSSDTEKGRIRNQKWKIICLLQ